MTKANTGHTAPRGAQGWKPASDLRLFCLSGVNLAAIAARLAAILPPTALPAIQPFMPGALVAALDSGAPTILFCGTPADHLVDAIQAGVAPSAALAAWQDEVTRLLDIHRRNRRRLFLVQDRLILLGQVDQMQPLLDRLGSGIGAGPGIGAWIKPATLPAHDMILTILALQALTTVPAARRLADELEVSSLSLAAEFPTLADLDAAWHGHAGAAAALSRVDAVETLARQKALGQMALGQERDLLRDQLGQLQQEVEAQVQGAATRQKDSAAQIAALLNDLGITQKAAAAERARQEKDLASLTAKLAREMQKGHDVEQARRIIARLTEETETSLDQLGFLQRGHDDLAGRLDAGEAAARARSLEQSLAHDLSLTAAQAQTQAREAELAARNAQLAELEQERQRIFDSRSWKVTKPLRATSRLLRPSRTEKT